MTKKLLFHLTLYLLLFSGFIYAPPSQSLPQELSTQSPAQIELVEVLDFGPNPGRLKMFKYIPPKLPPGSPLVVALHGCTMNAQTYAQGTGWLSLAQRWNFALLLPQQQTINNKWKCFNWGGDPNSNQSDMARCDTQRNCGENLSVKNMIQTLLKEHQLNPQRVYITGLSAGAAFSNVMLASYPDIFAGGGLIAGVPYLCNQTPEGQLDAKQAYLCMTQGRQLKAENWKNFIAQSQFQASPDFRWPQIQIWHGLKDQTVVYQNLKQVLRQWIAVQGLSEKAFETRQGPGFEHQIFKNAQGQIQLETYTLKQLKHAVPIDSEGRSSEGIKCGQTNKFMQEAKLCAAYIMGKRWGLDKR